MTREEDIRQLETMTKCRDLFDEDGGEILLKPSEMTLDDAIDHLDDTLSDTDRKWSCESCRLEHMQLRSWLAELRDIKQNQNEPLTLEELRKMDGEPVWIRFIGGSVIRNDGWFIISEIGTSEIFLSGKVSVYKSIWYYDETWIAYRQKPEEGTV